MRKRIAKICMILGTLFILSSLGLFAYNEYDSYLSDKRSLEALEELKAYMDVLDGNAERSSYSDSFMNESEEMPVVKIGEYNYIGYVSIPALDIELPVMEEWDYTRMKIAPCRYYGSYLEDNMVIAAHNSSAHFGKLKYLKNNAIIYFTDVNGNKYTYKVASMEILDPYDVSEMKDSGFDLTLFTCTYGGVQRVTVRCLKKS